MFRMFLATTIDYFPRQHEPVSLSKGGGPCNLWSRKWIVVCCL